MTIDELLVLVDQKVANTPPFTFSSPDVVGTNGGARTGSSSSEFDSLKDVLLFQQLNSLRGMTGEKFLEWRQNRNVK